MWWKKNKTENKIEVGDLVEMDFLLSQDPIFEEIKENKFFRAACLEGIVGLFEVTFVDEYSKTAKIRCSNIRAANSYPLRCGNISSEGMNVFLQLRKNTIMDYIQNYEKQSKDLNRLKLVEKKSNTIYFVPKEWDQIILAVEDKYGLDHPLTKKIQKKIDGNQ